MLSELFYHSSHDTSPLTAADVTINTIHNDSGHKTLNKLFDNNLWKYIKNDCNFEIFLDLYTLPLYNEIVSVHLDY